MKKSVVQRNASITTTTLKNRKINMKKTILALLVTTAITCGLFTEAKADSIAFTGSVSANHDSSVTSPTAITFSNPWTDIGGTGIFSGTTGAVVTMGNFSFTGDGASAGLVGGAFIQWSFTSGGNSYSFTLQSLTNMTSHNGIAGAGVGFAKINSTTYAGTWQISGSGDFHFVTTSVPDGGSAVALLGVALSGIEGLRRVFRRRSA
jgi:hypothetical protein